MRYRYFKSVDNNQNTYQVYKVNKDNTWWYRNDVVTEWTKPLPGLLDDPWGEGLWQNHCIEISETEAFIEIL